MTLSPHFEQAEKDDKLWFLIEYWSNSDMIEFITNGEQYYLADLVLNDDDDSSEDAVLTLVDSNEEPYKSCEPFTTQDQKVIKARITEFVSEA